LGALFSAALSRPLITHAVLAHVPAAIVRTNLRPPALPTPSLLPVVLAFLFRLLLPTPLTHQLPGSADCRRGDGGAAALLWDRVGGSEAYCRSVGGRRALGLVLILYMGLSGGLILFFETDTKSEGLRGAHGVNSRARSPALQKKNIVPR
jgi:hypothetical protein